jgi:hypothetical protein
VKTLEDVDECRVGDSSCKALCVCHEGMYGQVCHLNEEQRNKVIAQRTALMDGLDLLINNEDEDETTVTNWCNSLSDCTGNDPTLLSSTLIDSITDSVYFLLESSRLVRLTAADALLSSLDTVIQATSQSTLQEKRRRLRLRGNQTEEDGGGTVISNSSQ